MTRSTITLLLIFVTQVVANTAVPENPATRDYGQHIHPPLVRTVRSLEDELRNLPNENHSNNEKKLESITESSNSRDNLEASIKASTDPVLTSATDHSSDVLPGNPAATEYMLTSTSTPQIPNIDSEDDIRPSSNPAYIKNSDRAFDQSRTLDAGDDDEDDEEEDDDDSYNPALNQKSVNESQMPSTPQPAYVRDVYFFAKEDTSGRKDNENDKDSIAQSEIPVAMQDVVDSDLSLDQKVNEAVSEHENQQKKITETEFQNKNVNEKLTGPKQNGGQKELVSAVSDLSLDNNIRENQNKADRMQVYNSNDDDDDSLEIDIKDDTNPEFQHAEPVQSTSGTAVNPASKAYNEKTFALVNDYGGEMNDDEVEENNEDTSADSNNNNNMTTSPDSDDIQEHSLDENYENAEAKLKHEIVDRFQAAGIGKKLVKKSTRHSQKNEIKLNQSENEEILQLMIKVAEDPKDWEEIRELLEKIEYNETTLKKAKSRLRAVAKKQRIKNRKGHKGHKNGKIANKPSLKNEAFPKFHKQMTSPNFMNSAVRGRFKGSNKIEPPMKEPQDLIIATPHRNISPAEHRQRTSPSSLSKNKGAYIKVSVFPAKHHHHGRRPVDVSKGDEDYAIERPVTVIGARSRVDPVEKQLMEASANQRLREVQQQKARLAAIAKPTDEMEQQLKELTKYERRLIEHRHQKQKLMKIRAKDLQPPEQHVKW